jgi:hypothetical protein
MGSPRRARRGEPAAPAPPPARLGRDGGERSGCRRQDGLRRSTPCAAATPSPRLAATAWPRRFGVLESARFEPATLHRFNICPTEPIAVVDAERAVRTVRWGLVPPWARALRAGPEPINARSETVAERRPFAQLLRRPDRRCLVLADGWYEWLRAERKGAERVPFRYTSTAAPRSPSPVCGTNPASAASVSPRRRS